MVVDSEVPPPDRRSKEGNYVGTVHTENYCETWPNFVGPAEGVKIATLAVPNHHLE